LYSVTPVFTGAAWDGVAAVPETGNPRKRSALNILAIVISTVEEKNKVEVEYFKGACGVSM
jgi:hypothetical protein